MGSLILCHKKRAKRPFEISRVHMRIYTIEELCYYICNNLYLIDYTIVNERLCRWIGDELELPELSSELRRLLRENGSMEEFVLTILKESNIYAAAEIHKMQSVLEQLQSQRDVAKENHVYRRLWQTPYRRFYCYINMEEMSGNLLSITGDFPGVERRMWLGTKVFSKKSIPEKGIIEMREASTSASNAVRVAEGGWHFGYMGSRQETDVSKRIGTKVVAAAHQEYNNRDTLAEVRDRLILGQDIFGRNARFERVEVDESYPEYLLEHVEEYRYLIMPPVSSVRKIYTKILMRVKRFCRKAVRKVKRGAE